MTAHSKDWDEAEPAGSDIANQLDTFIQDFKVGLRQRADTEHYDLGSTDAIESDTSAMRHRPGLVGVVFYGTTAQINAIIATKTTPAAIDGQMAYGPGDGALFYNTDTDKLLLYDSENTTSVSNAVVASGGTPSEFRAKMSVQQTDFDNTGYTTVNFDTVEQDSGGEFDTGTYSFTPNQDGIYFIEVSILVQGATSGGSKLAIEIDGVRAVGQMHANIYDSDEYQIRCSWVGELIAGQVVTTSMRDISNIATTVWHEYTGDDLITSYFQGFLIRAT